MLSIKERTLILEWNKKGKTQQEIAELLGCHQSSISRLLDKYKQKRILANLPRSGRPTKLKGKTLDFVKGKILKKINSVNAEFNSVSTKQVKQLIAQNIGKTYSIRHVERIMHKLGFSLITPRPQHLRHDQTKVDTFREEFKKNLKWSMWIMK